MSDDREFQDIVLSVAEKSLHLAKRFQEDPERLPKLLDEWLDISSNYLEFINLLSKNYPQIEKMQSAYLQDAFELWQNQLDHFMQGKSLEIKDKRFNDPEWLENPFFNLLSQQYLLASEHATTLLEQIDCADKSQAKRMQFFMRQYLDALSPDNFAHTNPKVMAETIKSHGKNLLKGLQNLLSDMESDPSRLVIKMTDENAFTVGENIACTPGKVVFKNDLMELIQYTPQTKTVNSVPLLIIPPWINKFYILDLSPKNSLIRWTVSQGITVFVISWMNPNEQFANKGIADYLTEGPIEAISVIKKQLSVKEVNTLGFCIGGTLQSMLLAYNKAKKDTSVRSATFLAAMIDFSDPGDISVFIDEKQIQKVEKLMEPKGYLDGQLMANSFNSLRASDLVWAFFIRNYLHGLPPVPFDLLFWNTDTTNMPAKMHSEYLRWMYLQNDLIKPGKVKIKNVALDMTTVDNPVFFISTKKDHIAPWKTTYIGFNAMQGKKRFLLGGSGHIAGIVIPPGGDKYGFQVNDKSPENPDEWLDKSTFHPGSWWPEWMGWLKEQSGDEIAAPQFSKLPMKPLMDAPGSYVRISSKGIKKK